MHEGPPELTRGLKVRWFERGLMAANVRQVGRLHFGLQFDPATRTRDVQSGLARELSG